MPKDRERLDAARQRLAASKAQGTLVIPTSAITTPPAPSASNAGSARTSKPRAVGKLLGVDKRDGYLVVRFGEAGARNRHVVAAFTARAHIGRPRHAICWTCHPTGRCVDNTWTDGVVCNAEPIALAQLQVHGYRDV